MSANPAAATSTRPADSCGGKSRSGLARLSIERAGETVERPRVHVIGRDAQSQQALESALGNAFDLVDQSSLANVIVAPLATDRVVSGSDAGHVFTFLAEEQSEVPSALRSGAFYCVPE